jgi:hypothetical protein
LGNCPNRFIAVDLGHQGSLATEGTMDCCLYFPLLMYMEGAPLLDVMKIDLSLVGPVQSCADAARKVDVGGGDLDAISLLLDLHDAV